MESNEETTEAIVSSIVVEGVRTVFSYFLSVYQKELKREQKELKRNGEKKIYTLLNRSFFLKINFDY